MSCTVDELQQVYAKLPRRQRAGPVEVDTAERDSSSNRAEIVRIVDEVASGLDPEDRLLVQMRFWKGMKVPEISRILGTDQKKLYKRLEKLFALFRRALEEQAVDRAEIDALLARGDIHVEPVAPNVRSIKTADDPGIYVDPGTARRTLEELLREGEASGRK